MTNIYKIKDSVKVGDIISTEDGIRWEVANVQRYDTVTCKGVVSVHAYRVLKSGVLGKTNIYFELDRIISSFTVRRS